MQQEYNYTPLSKPIPITEQVWPEGTLPLVSTDTITYNHESFISECLDGILMQKTTFPVQVLVHDDCSTDKTADIIREYELKYPQLIKVFYQPKNIYSLKTIEEQKRLNKPYQDLKIGKYIAGCEGDDYWIDPNKLQLQVDFLEKNEDFAICYHNVMIIKDKDVENGRVIYNNESEKITDIYDLACKCYIRYVSSVFRNHLIDDLINSKDILISDYFLHLSLAKYGKIKFLPNVMAVYRQHSGGVWTSMSHKEQMEDVIKFVDTYMNYFNDDIKKLLLKQKNDAENNLNKISKKAPCLIKNYIK